jgi:site-specific DNA-methyltransferase (adenine-specific)
VIRIYREMRRGIQHPAVFPVEFASHLIRSYCPADNTVLDPFLGSGTTGIACLKLGRRFIGIEKSPEYFAIACDRIRRAYAEMPLLQEAS